MAQIKHEMTFYWDDVEEAYHRKTKTHIQNGVLKTWKLPHETQEMFEKRTRELFQWKEDWIFRVGENALGGSGIKTCTLNR